MNVVKKPLAQDGKGEGGEEIEKNKRCQVSVKISQSENANATQGRFRLAKENLIMNLKFYLLSVSKVFLHTYTYVFRSTFGLSPSGSRV